MNPICYLHSNYKKRNHLETLTIDSNGFCYVAAVGTYVIITDHVCSTRKSNAFTRVCDSVHSYHKPTHSLHLPSDISDT